MQLTETFQAIEVLGPVRAIATVPGLYPALSALHILGIGLLVGCIATVDLRLLGLLGRQLDAALLTLVRLALAGFALAVVTGLCLVSVRIASYAGNPAFLLKLVLLVMAGANAALLRLAGGSVADGASLRTVRARLAGIASLTLWIGAIGAGRWIAFV